MSSESSGWNDVTSGASTGVKGAYVELIASTTFASTWMILQVFSRFTGGPVLLDLAIGAMGSEVIILDDQYTAWRNVSGGSGRGSSLSFPMTVPLGSRISVRVSDTNVAVVHEMTLTISDETRPVAVSSSSDSSGVVIVSAGVVDTYGAWAELIASTTLRRRWIVVSMFQDIAFRPAELDIGIGSAGNEVPIMKDLPFQKSDGDDGVSSSVYFSLPIDVPAGTRIAARVKDDNVNTTPYTVGAFVT